MFSAIRTGRHYPTQNNSLRVDPKAIVRLKVCVNEEFQLQHRQIETATFLLVAQCPNQMRHPLTPVFLYDLTYVSRYKQKRHQLSIVTLNC